MDVDRKPLVRITHYRQFVEGDRLPDDPGTNVRYMRGNGFLLGGECVRLSPHVRGGETRAAVTVNGKTYAAYAECSHNDNFNYRLGRLIATGRLRKLLQHEHLEDAVSWPK